MTISEIKKIFKESFNFTRQNPTLWFLGFFLIFFINHEINIIISTLNQITTYLAKPINNIKIPIIVYSEKISNIFTLIYNNFQKFNLLYIVFVLIAVFLLLYLCLMAQIMVISFAKHFGQNFNSFKPSAKKIFLKSHNFLKPTIIIYLLMLAAIFVFLNASALFKKYLASNNFHDWLMISYIMMTLLLILILVFIAKFSFFFIIIKKEKLFVSIKKSVKFFFKNWLSIVKISLSLFIATILFGLTIFLIYIGILMPVSLLLRLLLYLCSPTFCLIIISALTFIISIIFLFFLSFFACFQFLVWPLYFIKKIQSFK